MAVVVGHGVIPIKPDFGADFHRNIQREGAKATDGLTKQFGGAFKNIAKLAGGIFVGAQVVNVFKSAFAEAAEAQKIGKLTEQVIKTTGGAAKITAKQIGELSTSISNKAGIDDEAIQSGANLVATFTKVRNEAGKGNDIFSQTVEVATDMSVALGQDMKSSSLQLGKALNDPIKGVTALTRAGVSFTQGQKDQIKKMQESGDLLGAQKLILAEVQTQFGGAAAAAASPVDKLKVVWGNLLEDLGTRALPLVETVATWLGERLPGALDIAGAAFGRVSEFLAPAVDVLKEFFYTLTSGFFEDEGTPVEEFALRVRDAIFGIIDVGKKIVPVLVDLWKNFTPIGLIVTHFEGVKTGIGVVRDVIDSFLDGLQGRGGEGSFFTDLGEAARGLARVFMEDVVPVVQDVISWIRDHLKPILITLGVAFAIVTGPVLILVGAFIYAYQRFEVFRDIVSTVMKVVKEIVTTYIDIMIVYFGLLLIPIRLAAQVVMEVLWPAVQTAFRFITDIVMWAWQNVLLPIFGFISAVITNVLIPAFNIIKTIVVDFVFPLVMAIIKDAWEVIRPVFEFIAGHVTGVVVPAFEAISDAVSAMWGFIQPILQTVITFIAEKLGPVWEGMRMLAKAAFDALPGLIGAALRLVGGIVAGFLDGVGSIADAIGLDSIAKVLKSGAGSARGWGQQGPAVRDQGAGQQLRNRGGPIYGPNVDRDIVPAMLTPGEFVMRRSAVEKYGPGFMAKVNAGRYRSGGLIPDIDIAGLADGVVDKVRSVGTAALDRVWPRLDAGGDLFTKTGLPAGGVNYMRDAALKLIRDKEAAMASQSGGGFTRSGGGGPAGQYTAGMQRARADILNLFGPMSVGGYSNRNIAGTNQRSQHAMWRAWDFMVGLGNVSKGNAVSRHLIANASKYGLKGLIWNAQKNFGSGWQPYGHPGGGRNATLQHLDHVHAEFFNQGGLVHLRNFDGGGTLAPGWNAVRNDTGSNETVVPSRGGPLIGHVSINSPEDVDEFWRRAEFGVMAGRL